VASLLGVACADEGCEKGNGEISNKLLDIDLSAIVVVVVGGELDRVEGGGGHEGNEVSLNSTAFMLLIEVEIDCL
jgi:hypothetical protein